MECVILFSMYDPAVRMFEGTIDMVFSTCYNTKIT